MAIFYRRMLSLAALAFLCAGGSAASAQTMVATRPGVMCEQADALAFLTLPDGSSRSAHANATPRALKLKISGGCIDIPQGAQVLVKLKHNNTSVVAFEVNGATKNFFVPNIDFVTQRGDAAVPSVSNNDPNQIALSSKKDSTTQVADLSVGSLHLGASKAEVEAKLGSNFKYENVQPSDPDVLTITATNVDRSNVYLLSFVNDRLWVVNHQVEFKGATELNLATLEAQIQAKFGTPTYTGGGTTNWDFDRNGRVLTEPSNESPLSLTYAECVNSVRFTIAETRRAMGVPGAGAGTFLTLPREFPSVDCPMTAMTVIHSDRSNDQLVDLLQVIVEDPLPMYHLLSERSATAAHKRKDDAEHAKSNSSPL